MLAALLLSALPRAAITGRCGAARAVRVADTGGDGRTDRMLGPELTGIAAVFPVVPLGAAPALTLALLASPAWSVLLVSGHGTFRGPKAGLATEPEPN